jgi:phenylacetate-CoA ligase
LLKYATENIPYYKKVAQDRDIKLSEGRVFDDLKKFPLLTKSLIHKHFDELYRFRDKSYYRASTSGSTGEPIQCYQDRESRAQARALSALFDDWSGYQAGQRKLLIWAIETDSGGPDHPKMWQIRNFVRNYRWIDSRKLNPLETHSYVESINTFGPVQIFGFPESVFRLSEFIKRDGLEVHSPKAVMTGGETLHAHVREGIERVFHASVFNRYGSMEVNGVACECERHQGLHVAMPIQYVEVVPSDGLDVAASPGEGEVIVTSLVNYTMPLIRYRIEDMASWGEACDCGRGWPVLKEVTGRTLDYFRLRDGTLVYTDVASFGNYPWIRKYQLIQEDFDYVRLLVVPQETGPGQAPPRRDLQKITLRIQEYMGNTCKVEIQAVEEIPLSPSGKYRYWISKVQQIAHS